MSIVRLFVVVGWLGLVLIGVGCTNPTVSGTDGSGDGSSGGADTGTGSGETGVDTGTSETGVAPECGNGLVEAGEDCDDGLETATCNANCTLAACGDGVANEAAGEECDGDDLAKGACEGLGFDVGVLACGEACSYDVSECYQLPGVPALQLSFSQIKRFDFSWAAVAGADYYRLEESTAPGEPFVQLGGDIVGESVSHEMPLHFRWQASYRLWACNGGGCTESAVVDVMGSLVDAVGYVKASNTYEYDYFGVSVALSGDGNTLAVGGHQEDSNATGIDGDQADDSANAAGAVYVLVRDGMGTWSQQAYVKASNTDMNDGFGWSVALNGDGNTLAVGAIWGDSNATGIGGDQADDSAATAGAVYVFVRDGMGTWAQQAYVKASNTDADDQFGFRVVLSGDGNTLAVSANNEDSNATGIDADQADDSAENAGAVYVFVRDGMGTWAQQAYLKASNTDAYDVFGYGVAVSGDGNTLAVGARWEDSSATGIDADQTDDSAGSAGAVYMFVRDGMGTWSQQAYIKASNTDTGDDFGHHVALNADGNTLAVGTPLEHSGATGIDADQADNSAGDAGAVYMFVRDGTGTWSQQAYIKASNTGASDNFGHRVALSGDGNILAVSALWEGSNAIGVAADQTDDSIFHAGAAYVFVRDGTGTWSQQAYLKASNTDTEDWFGYGLALSEDGNTLAASSYFEASSATGIGGDQADDSAVNAGAVYLY